MRWRGGMAAAVLAAVAAGCGGGVSAPTATEIRETVHLVAPREAVAAAQLSLGERGTIEVSVDWTVAANNIDVYATPGECASTATTLTASSCVVAETASLAAKPERLSFPGVPGGVYRVFVVNRGSQSDTVTVRVTVR